jgi:hypothetical protein
LQGNTVTKTADECWLDVLAGRAEPTDAATGEALRYREYFERCALDERAEIDEAAYLRTMNYLRARGAFKREPEAPNGAGKWRTMINRLRIPAQPGTRAALFVTLMLAVVVMPLVMHQPQESAQIKGLPKGLPPLTTAEENVLVATDPVQQARAIQAALILNGVASDVEPGEAQLLLTATVGAEEFEAAREALLQFGVALPADGRLRILIRRP